MEATKEEKKTKQEGKGKDQKEKKDQTKEVKVAEAVKPVKFSFIKDETDTLKDNYGILPFIQSKTNPEDRFKTKWTEVSHIDSHLKGENVKLRARLQTSRIKGSGGFIVLREGFSTIQGCLFVTENQVSKQMIKFAGHIPLESIVDVFGVVKCAEKPVDGCTQKNVELDILNIYLVVDSVSVLPFQLADANRKVNPELEEKEHAPVVSKSPVKAVTKPETEVTPLEKTEPTSETTTESSEKSDKKKQDKEAKKKEKEEAKLKKEQEKKEKEAASKGEKKEIIVNIDTRLDNRVLDLRVASTQSIMRLQSAVGQLFREYLYKNKFIEIHTPKLIGGSSEGGTNVFKLKYFEQDACLSQSPQLHKQMAIIGDMERVFEIGAVFRAENSNTPRHLCEFTGLDIEMSIKEHYFEVLDVIGELFTYIFEGLNERYSAELNVIHQQYPFEPLKFSKQVVKLDYREGVELLKQEGFIQDVNEDLDTINEYKLGEIVKKKYDTDFFILYRYPKSARPFYTMPDPEDPNFTNSYDAFIRGEEILSGAQRIHTYDLLLDKVVEKGVNPITLKDYLDAFKLGAPPHGGCGIGLERVVKLFAGLKSIKRCVMFPRDPKRLAP